MLVAVDSSIFVTEFWRFIEEITYVCRRKVEKFGIAEGKMAKEDKYRMKSYVSSKPQISRISGDAINY